MKGFFAFILDALRDVDVTKLKKPLYILATADEETVWPERVILPKLPPLRRIAPSLANRRPLQPVRAHKGHISNAIRIQGQSGTPAIQHAELTLSN
ncbi:hypothetical protein CF61_01100 [Escherichia coli]|nr:hypothetical protein CF61_01100 [Escherichia coli]